MSEAVSQGFIACFLQYLNSQWTTKKKKEKQLKQLNNIRNLALYKVIHRM